MRLLLARKDVDANATYKSVVNAPIIEAAQEGRDRLLRLLLGRADVEVNKTDWFNDTALMRAAYNGHVGAVNAILERDDADVDAVNRNGETALILAAYKKRPDVVRLLITARVRNITLLIAIALNNLIRYSTQPDVNIDARTTNNRRALTFAIGNSDAEMVELLLSREDTHMCISTFGVALDSESNLRVIDVMMAAAERRAEGNPDKKVKSPLCPVDDSIDVNATDVGGKAVVLLAAEKGAVNLAGLLIKAKYFARDLPACPEGYTDLHFMAKIGELEGVSLLLEREDLDVNARVIDNGQTPLMAALLGDADRPQVVKAIVEW